MQELLGGERVKGNDAANRASKSDSRGSSRKIYGDMRLNHAEHANVQRARVVLDHPCPAAGKCIQVLAH